MRIALSILLAIPTVATAGPDPAAVAPYLDPLTVAVAHVDLSRIDVNAAVEKVGELVGLSAEEKAAAQTAGSGVLDQLKKAGGRDVYAVVTLADGFDAPAFAVVPGADPAAIPPMPGAVAERIGNAAVIGSPKTLARLKKHTPTPLPGLSAAFSVAGDTAVRIAVMVPEPLRRSAEELVPTLPDEMGGGSTQVLTRGVRWAVLSADLTPKLSVRLTIQAANAEAAKGVADLFTRLKDRAEAILKNPPDRSKGWDALQSPALSKLLTINPAEGNRLSASLTEDDLTPVIRPMVVQARQSAERSRSMNNFKQLALAMHNYHDAHKGFPAPAIRSKDGKPLLSWRVAVLPYLEASELYKEFHLDEPWDSEHNKKLIPRMPAVLRSPFQTGPAGTTAYLVPVGDDTSFPPKGDGLKLSEFKDGTSNTIMLVEADDAHSVPWTKPDDAVIDPAKPIAGLRVLPPGVFLSAFADGSVRAISTALDVKMLYALFTRSGGEVVNID